MIAIDASLLAHAANRFSPDHARAGRVLEDLANGDRPWALPWSAADAFLRLVTHPHGVARPLQPDAARGFLEALLASPALHAIGPGTRHAAVLAEVLALLPARAGLPAGFEMAVVLREHGIRELWSSDRAMHAFAFLTVSDPLRGSGSPLEPAPRRRYRVLTPRRPRVRPAG